MKILASSILFLFLLSCGKESSKNKREFSEIRETPIANSIETQNKTPKEISFEEKYLTLLNDYRQKLNLSPLKLEKTISEVCFTHSQNMALKRTLFGHTGFSGRCSELRTFYSSMNLCGEVVANGQDDEEEVLRAWLNSYSHRLTLEGDRYTHTGISWVEDASGKKYWTQMLIEVVSDRE